MTRAEFDPSAPPLSDDHTVARRHPRDLGVHGLVLTVFGAVTLLVSFGGLAWFDTIGDAHALDLHDLVTADRAHPATIAHLYFGWAGWVLLIAALATATARVLRVAGAAVRIGGLLAATVGLLGTLLAGKLSDASSYSAGIRHASIGFWTAVLGFVLIMVGSLFGDPRGTGRAGGPPPPSHP